MQVILLEKVHKLGDLGDTVTVKAGYGRNFLIPSKMAVPANEANRIKFEATRAELEAVQASAMGKAQARANTLADAVISIVARAGSEGRLFGSVGTADIAAALVAAGHAVVRKEVRLSGGSLRDVGEHPVELHLHPDVNVQITVAVVAEGNQATDS
jgi:large subunit ribosomal protein L9